jgi:hypothetical protein
MNKVVTAKRGGEGYICTRSPPLFTAFPLPDPRFYLLISGPIPLFVFLALGILVPIPGLFLLTFRPNLFKLKVHAERIFALKDGSTHFSVQRFAKAMVDTDSHDGLHILKVSIAIKCDLGQKFLV